MVEQQSTSRSSPSMDYPPELLKTTTNDTVRVIVSYVYEFKLEQNQNISLDDATKWAMERHGQNCRQACEIELKVSKPVEAETRDHSPPRYSGGSVFTAKICTHPPINTSSATEEQDDDNAIKPLEESSSGSSQGSSREAVLSTCPQQWQNELGSSSVNKVDYKPHTGFKDPKDFPEHDEEQDSEAPLPPGIPEVSKQQYAKSSYADIPLRRSHQERSSRRCCAQQNRLSCPEFLLKIPKNTVTGQYPLMPNANIFHSSYGQKDYSHEEQFRSGVTEEAIADVCRQITTNPHCQETAGLCLSEEEEGAHHKEELVECAKPSANKCLKEVSAVQEQEPGGEEQQMPDKVPAQRCINPQPASGSGHSSQGTQPDERNPVIVEPQNLPHTLPTSGRFVAPEMNLLPKELISGDGSQKKMFVFQNTIPKRCNDLQEVKEGFPSKEESIHCKDGEVIYSNKKFSGATQISRGANCKAILPSPWAVKRLFKKFFHFAASMEKLWCSLLDHEYPHDCQALPHELLLGSGGNGITFEHVLMKQKYAVKWMDYIPKAFDAWSKFDHPNVIPLLGVVKVVRGCYVIMPRMTGDLGSVMEAVHDLYSLACSEDEEKWQDILQPNIQHILTSVLRGVAYLHKEGYQHRDLKETNILYLKKCECSDIFHCKCPPNDKCDIMIADFDSLKSYSSSHGSAKSPQMSNIGTLFYRSPEVHCGMVAPCCDMWSIGVIITSLCHDSRERKKIRENCRRVVPNPDKLKDEREFPVVETAYGREMLNSLRDKCIKKRDRLEPLARIAGLCLDLDNEERITAEKLLNDDFIKCPCI